MSAFFKNVIDLLRIGGLQKSADISKIGKIFLKNFKSIPLLKKKVMQI